MSALLKSTSSSLTRLRFLGSVNSITLPTRKFSSTKLQNKTEKDDDNNNEPIQFFGSNAATWRAKQTRSGGVDDVPWYQPYVISGSLAIFLLYFCVFREESDIDQKLEGSLFDKVEGLEETALIVSYKYNKEHGLDVTEHEKRLKELEVNVKEL